MDTTRRALLTSLFALAAVAVLATDALAATELRTTISGSTAFPAANGKARFRDRDVKQDLQAEVEDLPQALVGQTLTVIVDSSPAGTATVDAFGQATLRLDTQLGQTVPAIHAGSTILFTIGSTPIASGTF